jgi:hypothetical protein
MPPDILQMPDFFEAIFRPIEARYNLIRLAADFARSQMAKLASKR